MALLVSIIMYKLCFCEEKLAKFSVNNHKIYGNTDSSFGRASRTLDRKVAGLILTQGMVLCP